jgi:hypothetical protein
MVLAILRAGDVQGPVSRSGGGVNPEARWGGQGDADPLRRGCRFPDPGVSP